MNSHQLDCPVCSAQTGGSGEYFVSPWAVTLHLANKATTWSDPHYQWAKSQFGPSNLFYYGREMKLAHALEPYVKAALSNQIAGATISTQYSPARVALPDTDLVENIERITVEEKLDSYLKAYRYIWLIETSLHQVVIAELNRKYPGNPWRGFPRELRNKCLDEAENDRERCSPENYLLFMEMADVVKHNKDIFSPAFETLKTRYSNPENEFHRVLREANQIRNDVMHPLRNIVPADDLLQSLTKILGFVDDFVLCLEQST